MNQCLRRLVKVHRSIFNDTFWGKLTPLRFVALLSRINDLGLAKHALDARILPLNDDLTTGPCAGGTWCNHQRRRLHPAVGATFR